MFDPIRSQTQEQGVKMLSRQVEIRSGTVQTEKQTFQLIFYKIRSRHGRNMFLECRDTKDLILDTIEVRRRHGQGVLLWDRALE